MMCSQHVWSLYIYECSVDSLFPVAVLEWLVWTYKTRSLRRRSMMKLDARLQVARLQVARRRHQYLLTRVRLVLLWYPIHYRMTQGFLDAPSSWSRLCCRSEGKAQIDWPSRQSEQSRPFFEPKLCYPWDADSWKQCKSVRTQTATVEPGSRISSMDIESLAKQAHSRNTSWHESTSSGELRNNYHHQARPTLRTTRPMRWRHGDRREGTIPDPSFHAEP